MGLEQRANLKIETGGMMAQFEKAFSDRAASALRAWIRRDSHGMFTIDTKASVRRIDTVAVSS